MRIALVAVHTGPGPQAVPLANAFLQAYLATQPHIRVVTFRTDFFPEDSPETCAAAILQQEPDAVSFSLYLWNREQCREIAAVLRSRAPGIPIFAGGPEATATPAGVLDDGYDFLVCGEGEIPFAAVCRQLAEGGDVAGIPGIATRTGAGITFVPARPLPDLDAIPSPWLNGTLDAGACPGILWQLSRGCSFGCEFCFDSRDRHGVRRFSLERIEAELRHFAARKVSQVFVLDSTFNQDRDRAKAILRLIRKIAPRIHFHFEVRSEFIDAESARLFAAIACSLQIGLQSADPAVLKEVGRPFRPDDFANRTMLLNDAGAVFGFDLIYGLPGDTLAGFRRSLDFALDLYPNHLDIFPLAVLPGTPLAGRAAVIGLHHLPAPPYTVTSSPAFSAEELQQARDLAAACDIFYTRGRAVAWFNGALDVLRQRPADFLEQFGGWLEKELGSIPDEAGLSDERIHELQRAFLTGRFGSRRLQRLLPALLDLVDYHYHYAAALLAPVPPRRRRIARPELPGRRFRLSRSARLAAFHYDILEILEAGVADVQGFSDSLAMCGSWAVIYPSDDGVRTEALAESYFRLLERLDGSLTAGEASRQLGLPPAEAVEFMEFALNEGIVEPVGAG